MSASFPETVSIPRQHRLGRAGRLGLLWAVLALAAALLAVADSRVLPRERLMDAASARERLERGLGVHLSSVPPVTTAAGMTNVDATYSGQFGGQHVLVVVFNSEDAPVQIVRPRRASFGMNGHAIKWRNVVVLYDHELGRPNLAPLVSTVLEGPLTASATLPAQPSLVPLRDLGRRAPRQRTAARR